MARPVANAFEEVGVIGHRHQVAGLGHVTLELRHRLADHLQTGAGTSDAVELPKLCEQRAVSDVSDTGLVRHSEGRPRRRSSGTGEKSMW